ncbi:GH35 family endo-1,4-beta-xylanase/peptidoglycan/xylan/chitin deacetylase (PgdA/CDA1 family) [Paenibacillus phyllosphaerae]|uniref:Beta-xylanase n=1 Tax=Paenibacillus phyllosphaerae TaxID=274593 RepID=A0A7W5FQE7_9BACL|nr:endo-1,4-beta-xylanase [Paenibacillus phyllosphaerae]MBB3113203.1 GH35 family endo-1,4-beta-xylanase/peptidoglycan/xylan/chitin deacetylase (PgdA/CDA1 family) [Paenibacillus phyllosphaerae]
MSRTLRKTVAGLLTAALLVPSGWLAPAAAAAAPDIPVMLYHRVVANATDDWTHTSEANFKQQMKYLSDNGYDTLSAQQYVDILEGDEAAPDKPILLTFDDATPDFVTTALPVLKQYGMQSVQFVVSDWIDGGYSMTTAQLQTLASEPSVSLQNHSKTHNGANDNAAGEIWTAAITEEQATTEITAANDYLKGITGEDPVLLAYPYGAYNANAEAAAAANGLKYAFKVGYPNQGSYAMGRHYMQRGTTLSQFAAMVGGPAPAVPSEPSQDATVVYHETFADGQGKAVRSGSAALTPVTGKAFDGNDDGAALYVSNRTNNWDAVDFKFADVGLENGTTYTVTVTGYVDADASVPAGSQAYLQTVNSYSFLAGADFAAGSAFTLTKEFTVDTSKDTALRIQSSADGAAVPFYIGDVRITEKVASGGGDEEEETPRDPALPFNTITFEDQATGGFVGRAGTETLTVSNEANHTDGGVYALKVENRTNTWHGPALRVEKYVDKGYEYKISAWVKLISPASSQLQLSTQVGSTSPSYNNLIAKTINTDDGWVQYEGTYRYTNVGDEYLTIYVESSNNSTASFYIDDVSFERTGAGPVEIEKDLTPIKNAYADDFLIGNAVSAADLEGVRLELLNMHHNVVTAENAMKPDGMQPTKGNFTFSAADTIVDKALDEGLQVHGHVLVWHQQTPAWMNTATGENGTTPLSREEALANLRTHIKTVMEHYGDKVISWDVVNEAMIDNPPNPTDWQGALRKAAWYNAIGPDYVEQAFLAAREVLDAHPDWEIKLYYNDYNEDNQNKAQAIASMVEELNDRYAEAHPGKLLVDGIGMQAHYNVNTNPDNVKLSLEKFIDLGVEVSVTELDIQAGSNGELTDKQAVAQGYLYAQLMKLYQAHADHIERVTFWGLNDATSWRSANNPLLFDRDLQAKPAYYGVIDPDKFIEEHPPATSTANQSTAKFGTPVVDGTIDAAWSSAPEIAVNRYQLAWQGATGTARTLWDNDNLYVLIQVSDAQLDKSNANAWEQDSVEIFVDQNNAKTSFYQDDDGQYRVNFDNETSFNPARIAEGFASATKVSGTNYTVEAAIPLSALTPANDAKLGFDVQINDAKDGARQSVAAWNDTTGSGYMDTSVYGVLTLTGKETEPPSAPAAPTGLTAATVNDTSARLSWTDSSHESVTYSVHRATASEGPFTEVVADLNASEWTDTGLQPGTAYYYQVKAVSGELVSEASTTVSARTLLAPVANLTASAQNHKVIHLQWDDVQPSASYAVYRSLTEDGEYSELATGLSASQYVDNAVQPSTTYYYQVVADTADNHSAPASAHATTAAKPSSPSSGLYPTPSVNPNEEPNVSPGTNGSVTIEPPVKKDNAGRVTGNVSADTLNKALEQAGPSAGGKKQVAIDVPKQADATAYELQLPASSLNGQTTYELTIHTEHGTVAVPSNMLSNMTDEVEQVSIRIAAASTDGLDAAVREQIGDRPVLELHLLAGDKALAWNNPDAPVTVSVPYTPTAEELRNPDAIVVWYIAGDGTVTAIPNGRYDAATGTVVFQTTHFSTYAVASATTAFGDLQTVPWAQQAIESMAARAVIKGTSADGFSPNASITRADFIALLVRALELKGTGNGEATFSDVPQSAYYYEELAIAQELGIATGTGDTAFQPGSGVTRQDMMVLTTRALAAAGKQVAPGGSLDAFADAASVSGYAKASAAALVQAGIVTGKNGKLAPSDTLTRAEAAVILYRVWKL